MLSAERRNKCREMWNNAFDAIYDNHESMFVEMSELIITTKTDLACYDVFGNAYSMQPTPEAPRIVFDNISADNDKRVQEEQIEALEERIERLTSDLKAVESDNADKATQIVSLNEEISVLKQENRLQKTEIDELFNKNEYLRGKISGMKETIEKFCG